MSEPDTVFVFGSNLAGIHGAGAAQDALRYWGAKWGVGVGIQGSAYAIPTKNSPRQTLPLAQIQLHVEDFLSYALARPWIDFQVTRIGCGFAGYDDSDIAPLFQRAPKNCHLPIGWRDSATKTDQARRISSSG
jgi:hypothetical protein